MKALLCLCAFFALGCGGGLNLRHINSAAEKPSNVWVFFTVKKGDAPVGGLAAEAFTIYEDESKVSAFESKQVILNPDVAAAMYTLLLVDMSGSVTQSGEVDKLVDAAKTFTERVGKEQKVAVYAFEGTKEIHSVVPFTETKASVEGGLEGLRHYQPKDPSTNLHGAVVEALKTLKAELDKEKKPLKFGTLVVFSDGTDQAARVSREQMREELGREDYKEFQFYAIGVGAELKPDDLRDIGKNGTELAADRAKVQQAFDKIAERVEGHRKSFYLFSYCTPKRAGKHQVRIEAAKKDEKESASGSLEYDFEAKDFTADCDAKKPPRFKLEGTVDDKPADKPSAPVPPK